MHAFTRLTTGLAFTLALLASHAHCAPLEDEREDLRIFKRAAAAATPSSHGGATGSSDAGSKYGSYPLTLQQLHYPYDALEPVISKEIMMLHHDKHLQGYINGYNDAVAKHMAAKDDLKKQTALAKPLAFNAGGIVNHYQFFDLLAPPKSEPTQYQNGSTLAKAISAQYGSLEGLKTAMNATTASLQGSGWVWLGYDKTSKSLEVSSTLNQDTLTTAEPILGIDVWEHAYYLQYKNLRFAYLAAIWDVINWSEAQMRFDAATDAAKM